MPEPIARPSLEPAWRMDGFRTFLDGDASPEVVVSYRYLPGVRAHTSGNPDKASAGESPQLELACVREGESPEFDWLPHLDLETLARLEKAAWRHMESSDGR